MKFVLGDFKLWRIKKFIVLLMCMGISILVMFIISSDRLSSAFILAGLVLYAIIVDLSLIKRYAYTINVEDKDTEICIKKKKEEYFIKKVDIKGVTLKEIRYGGKWLDIIGYRLIIVADKKYIFDSVLLDENIYLEKNDLVNFYNYIKHII